ncbi:MAG: hypothetical protein GXZ14_00900 [Ruminococcaceae bacterium]|nr:hypothetical protein [Oscillospiraceae bacterium]
MESAIYPITEKEHNSSIVKKKKDAQGSFKQEMANQRRRERYIIRLINTNFDWRAYHIVLTYDDNHLPLDNAQAERDYNKWLRNVRIRCRAKGVREPKALDFLEWQEVDEENGVKAVRYHHHVIIDCGLPMGDLALLWNEGGRGLGALANFDDEETLKRAMSCALGVVNTGHLKLDKQSVEGLAKYVLKYQNRKHAWKRTRNLQEPQTPRPNDGKFTRAKVAKAAKLHVDDAAYWEKLYAGYTFSECVAKYNDFTGWSLLVKMYKS